jgi:hypothetical protein
MSPARLAQLSEGAGGAWLGEFVFPRGWRAAQFRKVVVVERERPGLLARSIAPAEQPSAWELALIALTAVLLALYA